MTYVQIGTQKIPAEIHGRIADADWGGRSSKAITCTMSYEQAAALFVDGLTWSIVYWPESCTNEETQDTTGSQPIIYDNSDYNVAGDIIDHRDGTVTVKMGKLTDLETTLEMVYGGETV